jgi:hypothetical protein
MNANSFSPNRIIFLFASYFLQKLWKKAGINKADIFLHIPFTCNILAILIRDIAPNTLSSIIHRPTLPDEKVTADLPDKHFTDKILCVINLKLYLGAFVFFINL